MIALPASWVARWTGVYGPDYARACTVEGLLGTIEIVRGGERTNALVIGDEPLATAFVPQLHGLLQWQYADSRDDLVAHALRALATDLTWYPGPVLTVDEELVVFDAAESGDEVVEEERLRIPWPGAGTLATFTADFAAPADRVAGRIHQLRLQSSENRSR